MEELSSRMSNPEQVYNDVMRYTLDVNDSVKLHVIFNQATAEKTAEYIEALKIARKIPYLDDIDNANENVKTLAMVLYNRQENLYKKDAQEELPSWMQNAVSTTPKKTPLELMDEAIYIWKKNIEIWINALQVEAFILALVSEGELEVDGKNINRGFFTHEYVRGIRIYDTHPAIGMYKNKISANYFDNTEINAKRQANAEPPVFKKDPFIVHEQMLAIIDAVKKENSDFALSLSQFFEKYAEQINGKWFEALINATAEVDVEYDDDGFHPGTVDGNTQPEDVSQNTQKQRKPRTTRAEVLALREGNS